MGSSRLPLLLVPLYPTCLFKHLNLKTSSLLRTLLFTLVSWTLSCSYCLCPLPFILFPVADAVSLLPYPLSLIFLAYTWPNFQPPASIFICLEVCSGCQGPPSLHTREGVRLESELSLTPEALSQVGSSGGWTPQPWARRLWGMCSTLALHLPRGF